MLHSQDPQKTTPEQWAWVAGVVEGEGWIGLRGVLCVQMTDADVIARLAEVTGMGTTVFGKKPSTGGRKAVHEWGVYNRREFLLVAEKLTPWLGERRRARLLQAQAAATEKRGRQKYADQNRLLMPDGSRYVRAGAPSSVDEQRERSRIRRQLWVAANREKVREYQRAYSAARRQRLSRLV